MFGILAQPLEEYGGAIGVFFLADAVQYELLNDQIRFGVLPQHRLGGLAREGGSEQ